MIVGLVFVFAGGYVVWVGVCLAVVVLCLVAPHHNPNKCSCLQDNEQLKVKMKVRIILEV